jgi:hypothetical protein
MKKGPNWKSNSNPTRVADVRCLLTPACQHIAASQPRNYAEKLRVTRLELTRDRKGQAASQTPYIGKGGLSDLGDASGSRKPNRWQENWKNRSPFVGRSRYSKFWSHSEKSSAPPAQAPSLRVRRRHSFRAVGIHFPRCCRRDSCEFPGVPLGPKTPGWNNSELGNPLEAQLMLLHVRK